MTRTELKGKDPTMAVTVSELTNGAQSTEASKEASHRSRSSPTDDDRSALTRLPLLAPFLTWRIGLWAMLEPLARVYREVGETEMVAEVSQSEGTELGIALE
ncbi:hypothetical protein GUJ93_ZPchr0001g32595 [Zizania palustris]|uniref:Uncharacterized protein n=1 Tax=Zizania palustris TaxID=103762 RepID=A0A8J5S9A2_ZIZPA|nr:hypothetical protein GUJ93_ZPchr0001g32595 [Zizania palustris]